MCWPDDRKQPLVYCSLIAIGFRMTPLMTQMILILMQTIASDYEPDDDDTDFDDDDDYEMPR
jgi:hypothetical protein